MQHHVAPSRVLEPLTPGLSVRSSVLQWFNASQSVSITQWCLLCSLEACKPFGATSISVLLSPEGNPGSLGEERRKGYKPRNHQLPAGIEKVLWTKQGREH